MKGSHMDDNSNQGNKTDLQILIQPYNEIDSDIRHSAVAILSQTLTNAAGLKPKNYGAHRNVNRAAFFEQDTLFETQYKLSNNLSDEMERGTQIEGGFPVKRSEENLKNSRLDEKPWDLPDFIDLEAAIRLLREDAIKYSKE